MRRRSALPDPEVDRGLRELEAALAGEPTADPDLLVLVADVDAVRPAPDAAFLASLDARVHAGFPREAQTPRRRTSSDGVPWHVKLRRPQLLAPVAVALVVVALVTVGIRSSDHSESLSSSSSGSTSAASSSAASTSAADSAAAAPQHPESVATGPQSKSSSASTTSSASGSSSSASALAAPAQALSSLSAKRKVERAASLTLTPAPADVQDTADGVVRATQSAGGYVQQSNVTTRDRSGSAQFTLRIPSNRLDAALAQLSRLAHVGALNQSSTDITAETNSAADRLQEANAERKALLRALGAATTTERISSLKARLADNRKVIAARKTELTTQQRRAQFATVAVAIEGRRGVAPRGDSGSGGGGPWSPGDALHDAGRVLAVALGVALIALAVLLPLGLVALLAALAARALRRHRRESALDGSGA